MLSEQIFEAGSLEWLEARNKCITATEVSTLFGLNKYMSPKKLLQGKIAPQKIWSTHIRRGRILEPAVIQAIREDLKWEAGLYGGVRGVSFFKHPDCRLSATPDAMVYNEAGEIDSLLECKTATAARLDDWDFAPPTQYLMQVHVQMMCTDIKSSYIACLGAFDPFPLVVYEVKWDERINKQILTEVDRWWDCFDRGVEFVVEKDKKADMKALLESNVKRIY